MVRLFNIYVPARLMYELLTEWGILLAAVLTGLLLNQLRTGVPALELAGAAVLFPLTMVALIALVGLYHKQPSHLGGVLLRIALACVLGLPVLNVLAGWLPAPEQYREAFEFALVFGVGSVAAHRAWVHRSAESAPFARRVLVVGVGAEAAAVEQTMRERADQGVRIVGFLPVDAHLSAEGVAVSRTRILPAGESLGDLVERLKVDEVIVAVRERRGGVLPLRQLLDCKLGGVKVVDQSTFFERVRGQIPIESLRASWLIYGEGFRQSPLRRFVKRASDLIASLILLIVALPVMALTALAILLESGFPILYRQERVGQGGRTFNVLKFRSMRNDAEADGKPRWASTNDDRITRVGRFIRRTRIDELPQIFNVLKGDMSFVGPRPERPYFVDQLTERIPFYAVRHSVKPGITGWAQVSCAYGASVDEAADKLQFDLYYVKNHTLALDTLILLKTVRVVLTGDGAR